MCLRLRVRLRLRLAQRLRLRLRLAQRLGLNHLQVNKTELRCLVDCAGYAWVRVRSLKIYETAMQSLNPSAHPSG